MDAKRRLAQVNELLRETIGEILVELNSEPLFSSLTVTEVRVTSDLSSARVFVMSHRPLLGEAEMGTVENLRLAAERVQKLLGPRVRLKRTPRLRFEIDDALERAERVDRLLDLVREDWENADGNSER